MEYRGNKYYFLGIGGIGMSALAQYLFDRGNAVMGYDKTPSLVTEKLTKKGIPVVFDFKVSAIPKIFRHTKVVVVYTPALPEDHPQHLFFRRQGNQIKKRSLLLGEITESTTVFAIAGTHGKTTTASILTHLFDHLKLEFTAFLGGIMNTYQNNIIQKGNQYSIVEADEYDRSFLQLSPDYTCITATDADHLDCYGDFNSMQKAYVTFSEKTSRGLVVARGVSIPGISYGTDRQSDYQAKNILPTDSGYVFDLVTPNHTYRGVFLNAIGPHNLLNALGAIALLDTAGFCLKTAIPALATFEGIHRRMEKGILGNKILIDDYAHHPEEIKVVWQTLKEFYPNKKNLVVFQPHLFSRTHDFKEQFAQVLDLFDEIVLLDIYPAREKPISGVTSQTIADRMKNKKRSMIPRELFFETVQNSNADLVVILGAGDIGNLVQKLKKTA
ncbi:MAG: UDP-N-acetylmuramate--L-alanine ligase [Flavobacteriia bacterium]|nr:UDP-N-acetylmuramate--L-alanine ligase [Flavobacteriia bacterium]